MAGAATGRFTSSKPAIHNFSAKNVDRNTFYLETEKRLTDKEIENRYDLRSLLVKENGVFRLDFASQENRTAVLLSNSSKDAKIFIENKDIHKVRADELGTTREIAKAINLGLNYGMGKYLLATKLGLSVEESEKLKEEFWRLNPQLREFKQKLLRQDVIKTPLYNRILKLGTNHTRLIGRFKVLVQNYFEKHYVILIVRKKRLKYYLISMMN